MEELFLAVVKSLPAQLFVAQKVGRDHALGGAAKRLQPARTLVIIAGTNCNGKHSAAGAESLIAPKR